MRNQRHTFSISGLCGVSVRLAAALTVAGAVAGGCAANTPRSRPVASGPIAPMALDVTPAYVPPASPLLPPAAGPETTAAYTPGSIYTETPASPASPKAHVRLADASAAEPRIARGSKGGSKYIVQKGDTFYRIARDQYGDGKQWTKIAAANPEIAPNSLKVGQKLNVP